MSAIEEAQAGGPRSHGEATAEVLAALDAVMVRRWSTLLFEARAEGKRAGAAKEREACAKLVETERPTRADGLETTEDLAEWLAAKIRARST